MARQIKIIVDDIEEVPEEIIFVKPHLLGVYEYVRIRIHSYSMQEHNTQRGLILMKNITKEDQIYQHMSTYERKYADEQFWSGMALGVVLGILAVAIGLRLLF